MAVFINSGTGNIYAGESNEAVLAEILENEGLDGSQAFEVAGSHQIAVTDENDERTEEMTTLDEEYRANGGAAGGAYCIATED